MSLYPQEILHILEPTNSICKKNVNVQLLKNFDKIFKVFINFGIPQSLWTG